MRRRAAPGLEGDGKGKRKGRKEGVGFQGTSAAGFILSTDQSQVSLPNLESPSEPEEFLPEIREMLRVTHSSYFQNDMLDYMDSSQRLLIS